MKHLFYCITLILLTSFADPTVSSSNQKEPAPQYPQGYFQPPVGHSLALSGTFGELRPHHFHAGIDIAPDKKLDKEPIYAAAEGYVSRINIQGGGYGQALYINHSNGYKTVYGHLDKFMPAIQAFLRQKQYEKEQFEQDITLQPNEIPIARGQYIGNMGNRGHSFGEHLHFEIRDTKTDRPINPLLFGFDVPDNIAPSLQLLKAYFMNDKKEVLDTKTIYPVKKGENQYGIQGDTLTINAPYVAFAVKTNDKDNSKNGDNGVFSIELKENDNTAYKFKTETCPFSETRYMNAHVDYREWAQRNSFFHRTFILPGNHLSMYETKVNNGIVHVHDGVKKIDITTADIAGNKATISFYVQAAEPIMLSKSMTYTYFLPVNEPSIIKPDGAHFYFPKNSFYENIYLNFNQSRAFGTEGGTYGEYSPTYYIQDAYKPIHAMYTINLKPQNLPDSLHNKAFIAYCAREEGGRIYSCGGKWSEDGSLMTKNNRFGGYCIMVDQEPPTIKPVSFQYDMRKASRLAFKIRDNYEPAGIGEGLTYRAEVDGQWLLLEYDSKYDLLFHKFDENRIAYGEHYLKLSVKDSRGNERILEGKFKR
jgi:hypothetical protein